MHADHPPGATETVTSRSSTPNPRSQPSAVRVEEGGLFHHARPADFKSATSVNVYRPMSPKGHDRGGMGDDVAGIDGADGVEGGLGSGVSTPCTFGWLALSIPTRSMTTE